MKDCKLCGRPIEHRWWHLRAAICRDAHECLWAHVENTMQAEGRSEAEIRLARAMHDDVREQRH